MSARIPAVRAPLPLLLRLLRDPDCVTGFTLADWDLALRQMASGRLTASVGLLLVDQGLLAQVPAPAREHLDWAMALAERHGQAVRWEVDRIGAALGGAGIDFVLLKGAAYAIGALPAARGRVFTDIDVLVRKADLPTAESVLILHGWASTHLDAYDQRYYREWMHELPPMAHVRRGSALDLHHAILPATAAAHPDPAKLFGAAQALPGHPGVAIFAPADLVLHSAVHMFYDGEFDHAVRDLLDIHRLLAHYGSEPGFWPALAARAQELEVARPLFYALRYSNALLGTPVPAASLAGGADAVGQPPRALLALMDALFVRALLPDHASCDSALTSTARFLLYIRANWLRMPPLLLARHLFHKAFLSPKLAE